MTVESYAIFDLFRKEIKLSDKVVAEASGLMGRGTSAVVAVIGLLIAVQAARAAGPGETGTSPPKSVTAWLRADAVPSVGGRSSARPRASTAAWDRCGAG